MQLFSGLTLMVAVLILSIPTVHAHRPIFVEDEYTGLARALPISDPGISWAVYGHLPRDKAHFYTFAVPEEGLNFYSQVLTPRGEQAVPHLALLGSGLPRPETELPFSIPEEMGAIVVAGEKGRSFFEPFTQTRYNMGRELRRPLSPGRYWLAVWHPDGRPGKYTLAVGEREEWSWQDIFRFPRIWLAVRWWYSPWQTATTLILLAVLAGLLLYWLGKNRAG